MFFDSYVQVETVDGKTEVKGINWLGDRVAEEGVAEIVSPAEILINFSAQYDGGQQVVIKSITAGYYVGEREGIVRATASPVWQIMTEEGRKFYYDMRNGDLL